MPATPGIGLELGLSSSARTGDKLTTPAFTANFGSAIAGRGASGDGGGLGITGLAGDIAKGVAVAIAARYMWTLLK